MSTSTPLSTKLSLKQRWNTLQDNEDWKLYWKWYYHYNSDKSIGPLALVSDGMIKRSLDLYDNKEDDYKLEYLTKDDEELMVKLSARWKFLEDNPKWLAFWEKYYKKSKDWSVGPYTTMTRDRKRNLDMYKRSLELYDDNGKCSIQ